MRIARLMSVLPILAFLLITSPALAGGGVGKGGGHGYGHSKGGGGGKGGAKGTPAPIAGLGVLALGAIGYGTRKLQKHKQK